jgi:IclR family transcriptional regulator, pca regulon regulatory protein
MPPVKDIAAHADSSTASAPSDSYVQSFARGLAVIRAFSSDAPVQTLTEVASRAGLDRAGARRILLTLAQLGYVSRDGRDFRLTAKTLDLGYAYLSTTPLWNSAEPEMEALVAEVRESCSVSVLDGFDVVYILRVPTSKIMTISLGIGSRLPAFCTSMGRVLLGGLDDAALEAHLQNAPLQARTRHTVTDPKRLKKLVLDARAAGYSMVDQELEEGLTSIAVPLFDRSGRMIASMNVSANSSRASTTHITRKILPALKRAGERINAALRMRA